MKISTVLSIVMLCSIANVRTVAFSAEMPSAPKPFTDGLTVLAIKDVHIAFPSQGLDLNMISINNWKTGQHASLQSVIKRPAAAEHMFEQAVSLDLHISVDPGGIGLFLDRFDRSDFQSFSADISIGENAQNNCRSWENEISRLRETPKFQSHPAGAGWFEQSPSANQSNGAVYLQKGEPAYPPLSTAITCDPLGICHSSRCIGNNIGVSFQFTRRIIGVSRWDLINGRALELMKLLLIDPESQVDLGARK